jgi:hypothetical protein
MLRNILRSCGALLLAMSFAACATGATAYKPQIPRLQAEPLLHESTLKDKDGNNPIKVQAVTLLAADLAKIIVSLEAACKGAGYDIEDCLTD